MDEIPEGLALKDGCSEGFSLKARLPQRSQLTCSLLDIEGKIMNAHVETKRRAEISALALRLGLGIVFVIGGANKLNQLMDPATHDGLVASYTGTTGYINSFFLDYLFGGRFSSRLTADLFRTLLSSC